MPRSIPSNPRPQPIRLVPLALALALAALLVPAGASASQSGKVVAKTAANATLGKTILTNTKGRTLYSLSVETKGKIHLHRGLSLHLAPARRPGHRQAEGAGQVGDDRTARRPYPGHLQGPPALQLQRRYEIRRSQRRGNQGRRHLARGERRQARPPAPTHPHSDSDPEPGTALPLLGGTRELAWPLAEIDGQLSGHRDQRSTDATGAERVPRAARRRHRGRASRTARGARRPS